MAAVESVLCALSNSAPGPRLPLDERYPFPSPVSSELSLVTKPAASLPSCLRLPGDHCLNFAELVPPGFALGLRI